MNFSGYAANVFFIPSKLVRGSKSNLIWSTSLATCLEFPKPKLPPITVFKKSTTHEDKNYPSFPFYFAGAML
ncbi:MAG: hypothetical protein ACE5FF_15615, partial [Saprospiraceae bacterium]